MDGGVAVVLLERNFFRKNEFAFIECLRGGSARNARRYGGKYGSE